MIPLVAEAWCPTARRTFDVIDICRTSVAAVSEAYRQFLVRGLARTRTGLPVADPQTAGRCPASGPRILVERKDARPSDR
jgi:hypothetical protein